RSDDAPSNESRQARLQGVALSPGSELGRVETLPTFEGLAALWAAREAENPEASGREGKRTMRVEDAFANLVRDLGKARRRVAPRLDANQQTALDSLALLETDSRLLEALAEEGAKGNVPLAMRKVARDYAQAPYRGAVAAAVQGWLAERSEEVEELCLLVAAR